MSVSSYKCALVVVSIVFAVGSVRTWELGVMTDNQLHFFKNKTVETSVEDLLQNNEAITYDPVKKDIYVFDTSQLLGILKTTGVAAYTAVERIVQNQLFPFDYVGGMAFDHRTSTLYWTNSRRSIKYMHVSDNKTAFPHKRKDLLTFEYGNPKRIAIDTCRGYLYWTNTNASTIERSRLDGSEYTVFIHEQLYQPLGIAVDLQNGLLYWSNYNYRMNGRYSIEAIDLEDGSRRTLIRGTNQKIDFIALDERDIYWADLSNHSVWTMPKNTSFLGGVEPTLVVKYDYIFERLMGLITSTPALNDTQCIAVTRCHGYCVSGTCTVDKTGRPKCQCPTDATGERCDQTCTDKTCQNGGQCLLDKDGRKLSKIMIGFLFVMVACWGTTTLCY